jgi:hypothetical protein
MLPFFNFAVERYVGVFYNLTASIENGAAL